jgi:SAM-dependent methyltransferase
LGGYSISSDAFPHSDPLTWYPELWEWACNTLHIRSVLDVGCGEGHSAAYFKKLGCEVLGVDGSAEAMKNSRIPEHHVMHDFEESPFIPQKTYDLVWSCEFVEHVDKDKVDNILKTFSFSDKYLMITFAVPGQLGWHHVNLQPAEYWIKKMLGIGFGINLGLTLTGRRMAGAGHFAQKGLIFTRSGRFMGIIRYFRYKLWRLMTEGPVMNKLHRVLIRQWYCRILPALLFPRNFLRKLRCGGKS